MEEHIFSDRKGLLDDIEDAPSRLSGEASHDYLDTTPPPRRSALSRYQRLLYFFYLTIVHIGLLIALWRSVQLHRSSEQCSPVGPIAPIYKHDEHVTIGRTHGSPYAGPPRKENEKAWNDLIHPMYVAVSESELRSKGESVEDTVQMESGEYVASANAYHGLHCIRWVRMYIYRDTYFPNLTISQEEYLVEHMDHCLDWIRQDIMCYGDTSIRTFFWHDPPQKKPGVKSNAQRTCVNWDRFQEWSLEHMVPLDAAMRGGPGPMQPGHVSELLSGED